MDLEFIEHAYQWYEEHKEHVEFLIKDEMFKVEPSKEDATNPALWKSIHWVWFFDNYNMQ